MPLLSGTRFGPYEIVALVGAGGMGEVYKARDTRLQRDVAIKVLSEEFTGHPDRRARFEREARAVAALSHPNIVALYDIGEEQGRLFMVSELVPGETLRSYLRKGSLPVRETLAIAVQIAHGLAAAHEAGITHRDLKPENLMITADKTVKILDFGLARQADEKPLTESDETVTVHHQTQPGVVMGTPYYMSPEQARGAAVDFRSDQFSLGLIVHEMLTGKATFRRSSIPESMAAILKEDALALDSSVPSPLRWIVERMLAKEPEERYASTKDLYRDLRAARDRPPEVATVLLAKRRSVWPFGLAAACLAGGAAIATLLAPPSGPDQSKYKFTSLARDHAAQLDPAWSPDGKSIAYAALVHGILQIFIRTAAAPTAAQLTHASRNCRFPFWSPDGLTVYYPSGGNWWTVGASGGVPQPVFKDFGPVSIHPDGKTFAVARDGKLYIGPADESKQREYKHEPFPSPARFLDVRFSPDGSKLAAKIAGSASGQQADVWVLPLVSGGAPRLVGGIYSGFGSNISWFPDNRRLLLGRRDGDTISLDVLDTATGQKLVLWSYAGNLGTSSVSPDGKRIAFTSGENLWELAQVSLPDGQVSSLLSRRRIDMYPDWSPSGTHYLHSAGSPTSIEDVSAKEGFARVVVSLESEGIPKGVAIFLGPRWAPDGQRFAFGLGFGGGPETRQLWVSNISGGRPFPLPGAKAASDLCWSPDGEWIAYLSSEGPKPQLVKIRVSAGSNPIVLADVGRRNNRSQTQWSPAGNWILYPGKGGFSIVSPDGKVNRTLTARPLTAYGFSKRGDQVIGIFQEASAEGVDWRLISIDVKTGAEKQLATLNLPEIVSAVDDFSLHPDGNRFATSIARAPSDIYMLEGFEQPKSWLDRLLGR